MPKLEVHAMKQALRLASKGRGRTSPNPLVGAVVVQRDQIVGEGWHRGAGMPHAEPEALAMAGKKARGAVMYVNLEPCAHSGRTGPCTRAIIEAGISRVVAAMVDPDPQVSGKGISDLRAAGIEVEVGLLGTDAQGLNEAYVVHRSQGRPFVLYKVASTFDGRTGAPDRSSKWISGEKARSDVHRLRSNVDAIMVGVGTVLADDPSLTVRKLTTYRHPLRVVVDSHLRTAPNAKVLSGEAPTLIFSCEDFQTENADELKEAGAEIVVVGNGEGGLSIKQMLAFLAQRNVVTLLLEGGPTLAGSFEREDMIDKYVLYLSAKLVGGHGSAGILEGWAAESMTQARGLEITGIRKVGADVRIEAYPVGRT